MTMRTIKALLLLALLLTATGCQRITAIFSGGRAGAEKLICHIDSETVIGQPVSSPDSRRVAYVAKDGAKRRVIADGKEEKAYDFIDVTSLAFSPDSHRVAYVASAGGKQIVVVDGKDGKPYDEARSFIFSPDSRRVAYAAKVGEKWLVVVDGKEEKAYDIIAEPSMTFSPNSSRIAHLARGGDQWVAVVDGVAGKAYDDAQGLIFSPDSQHVAYVANIEGKEVLLVDGKKQGSYDYIGSNIVKDMKVLYSPDGKKHGLWSANQRYVDRGSQRQAGEILRCNRRSHLQSGQHASGLRRQD
jgi:outer membrane lipoprotein-sorting protein